MRDSGDWRLLFFHAARLLLVSAYSRFFTAEKFSGRLEIGRFCPGGWCVKCPASWQLESSATLPVTYPKPKK